MQGKYSVTIDRKEVRFLYTISRNFLIFFIMIGFKSKKLYHNLWNYFNPKRLTSNAMIFIALLEKFLIFCQFPT